MKRIDQNPYQLIGIAAGSISRELSRRESKVNAFAAAGRLEEYSRDCLEISKPERTEKSLKDAFATLNNGKLRVEHALFWLTDFDHVDKVALTYLRTGEFAKALAIWGSLIREKQVTDRNFSAFNNYSTLCLERGLRKMDLSKKNYCEGVALKVKLISSEVFTKFCEFVDSKAYPYDQKRDLDFFISTVVDETQSLSSGRQKDWLLQMAQDRPEVRMYLSGEYSSNILSKIEARVEETKEKRNRNPENGLNLGRLLIQSIEEHLSQAKDYLETSDLKFRKLSDAVARELHQCAVVYVNWIDKNDSGSLQDVGEAVMELLQRAQSIATSEQMRESITDTTWIIQIRRKRAKFESLAPEEWRLRAEKLNELPGRIKEKKITKKFALRTVRKLPVYELNSMGVSASEFRDMIVLVLKDISISLWNTYRDCPGAISVLQVALSIDASQQILDSANADLDKLREFLAEIKVKGEPITRAPHLKIENGQGLKMIGDTLYSFMFSIPLFPVTRYRCEKDGYTYRFFRKLPLKWWQIVWRYLILAVEWAMLLGAIRFISEL